MGSRREGTERERDDRGRGERECEKDGERDSSWFMWRRISGTSQEERSHEGMGTIFSSYHLHELP